MLLFYFFIQGRRRDPGGRPTPTHHTPNTRPADGIGDFREFETPPEIVRRILTTEQTEAEKSAGLSRHTDREGGGRTRKEKRDLSRTVRLVLRGLSDFSLCPHDLPNQTRCTYNTLDPYGGRSHRTRADSHIEVVVVHVRCTACVGMFLFLIKAVTKHTGLRSTNVQLDYITALSYWPVFWVHWIHL